MNLDQFGSNSSATDVPPVFREGKVARTIERATARIPSDVFLWLAGGAMAASCVVELSQSKRSFFGMPTRMGQLGLFVGQWVPTLLLFGVYNKIVKVLGRSDEIS